MEDIEKIRQQENQNAWQHLMAIRLIMSHKMKRDGIEKNIAELVLHGLFQFSFKDGLKTFGFYTSEGQMRHFEELGSKIGTVSNSKKAIHKENRDWVRHLIAIRNIRNTKCARCRDNCLGCGFSGREFFNIASALKLIMVYDWESISEVLGLKGYEETNKLVYELEDCLCKDEQIVMAKPEYEIFY